MTRITPGQKSHYDVVIGVTYYYPYVSGLSEVVRIEAEELAARGLKIAVVTNAHESSLPAREIINGVSVHRCPVWLRLGRGIASPTFIPTLHRLSRRARAVHLHAPMLEAGPCASLAARYATVVLTHHIDLWVPRTLTSPAAVAATNASTRIAMMAANTVVVNSQDQAKGSRFASLLDTLDVRAIPAPCVDRRAGHPHYRDGSGQHHFGFLGRIVEEKGLGFLLDSFAGIEDPGARLLIGGEYADVAGGGVMSQLRKRIEADPRIRVLGMLRGKELDDFYASIDTFVLPSVAESFGIVQAEAIMTGVPSITTDLPGGRYPVMATGLGQVVPPADVDALRDALLTAIDGGHQAMAAASSRGLPMKNGSVEGAARWAREHWGIDRFVEEHLAVLGLTDLTSKHTAAAEAPPA